MMHDREKSDPAIVAKKSANKAGRSAAERMERHGEAMLRMDGRDQEERERAKHAPDVALKARVFDTTPGSCDPGARPRTARCKAKKEGEVHVAPPPHQH
jgi:hypothetical protein